MELLDGRACAAGELARAANASPQSASMHLAQLLDGGFVKAVREGRHRYYRIAGTEVAHAIEALGVISTPRERKPMGEDGAIRYARSCYDHLAGELGVRLTQAFEQRGFLVARGEREYGVTRKGEDLFGGWRIDVQALRSTRRSFARRCLDWTERRDHLGGALGGAVFDKLIEFRWIARDPKSRVIRVSQNGKRHLEQLFD